MLTFDPRVDAYIAKAQPFAQPILTQLREVLHAACPEVEETIKWGMPAFMYHGILAGMASFKAHAAFGFWKGELITDTAGKSREAMWQFGKITSVKELPSKRELSKLVKQAMKLNKDSVHPERVRKHAKPALRTPTDLATALKSKAKARTFFASLAPSAKRDYIEWITDAKRAETRATRVATAVQWLGEGKRRNWKYER